MTDSDRRGSTNARPQDWFGMLLLALGLVLASLFLADAVRDFSVRDRYVEVKGLAEREVQADLAIWPITYSLSAETLEALRARMDRTDESVIAYLKLNGFEDREIRRTPPQVTDRWLNSFDNQRPADRYSAQRTLTLRTTKVDATRQAMDQAADLISQGVPLMPNWGNDAQYLFTGLEAIKPEMIAEATADARRAADQFAEDSGSDVGAIRSARQGYFTIDERDRTAPETKRVRVVTTIEYFLDG
ncbi:SIMPL domain-containing protein [Wenzhouxiangella sp. XN79A]|uniref:SIMPL domain-containing protein n=1 Tax=Wenzhouxiangella sp. XN79A TaxID=2724193 RepID=UPI00144A7FB9|nr:SIMPL domain-containing protein [Wenzhouxiangella sp. XN79A]NKI35343.1 SIMPL domain-containing protein [Wenzhouxiangella sp. XN79A]